MAYQQNNIFHKCQETEKWVKMIAKFGISRSTISFQIAIVKLIDEYPKAKNSSLSFNFLKKTHKREIRDHYQRHL